MVKAFLRVVGALTAHTLGRLDRYTGQHRKFLSSGFVCQNCNQTLIVKWWTAGVNCYDSKGEKVPANARKIQSDVFSVPKVSASVAISARPSHTTK